MSPSVPGPDPAAPSDPLSLLAEWLHDACFTVEWRLPASRVYLACEADNAKDNRRLACDDLGPDEQLDIWQRVAKNDATMNECRSALLKNIRDRRGHATEVAGELPKVQAEAIALAVRRGEARPSATEIVEAAGEQLIRLESLLTGFPIKGITRESFKATKDEVSRTRLRLRRLAATVGEHDDAADIADVADVPFERDVDRTASGSIPCSTRGLLEREGIPADEATVDKLEKRLARYRRKDSRCFVEAQNPEQNRPRILYIPDRVRPVIERFRASLPRPSEK